MSATSDSDIGGLHRGTGGVAEVGLPGMFVGFPQSDGSILVVSNLRPESSAAFDFLGYHFSPSRTDRGREDD